MDKVILRRNVTQNFFSEKSDNIKSLCDSSNNLELLYHDQYKT